MIPYRSILIAFGISVLAWACVQSPTVTAIEDLDAPTGAESGQPHIATDENGTVWLSWIEPTGNEDEHTLRYASFDGSEWSEPTSAATGVDWFVNWADVPSVNPLPDGRLAAHYLVSSGPHIFAYDVHITQQNSSGEWLESVTPHTDGTETEHGFVSMLPWGDGDLLTLWLDGREMNLDEDDHGDHGSGAMTLRGAVLDASSETLQKDLIDDHVCECCPTSGVLTDEGALFAYRDRTVDEIRNISLVRYNEGAWSEPYELHDDNWEINGCPVNGPALAADGSDVVAAWFTAPAGNPQVNAAFSDDGGASFSDPILIDGDRPGGQVDAVLLENGTAVISWYGRDEDAAALQVQALTREGKIGAPFTVVSPMPDMRTGIPRMTASGENLLFTWVEEEDDRRSVKVKRMPFDMLLDSG